MAQQNSALILDAVMPGARPFLRAQQMLVVAHRDAQHRPWASILFGAAGFVSASRDGRSVTIDRMMTMSGDDGLWANLVAGASVGLLAIELSMRRRLRINGRIAASTCDKIDLHVDQAYANCPKYIQRRHLRSITAGAGTSAEVVGEGTVPDDTLLTAVRAADTAFVATGHPTHGLDASHRGGPPGFINILRPDLLRLPDYAGNGMFNTLGNLIVDPRCSLTILEFETGRLHQMTGTATVHLDAPAGDDDDPIITSRYWDYVVQTWRSLQLPMQLDWEYVDASPYNP